MEKTHLHFLTEDGQIVDIFDSSIAYFVKKATGVEDNMEYSVVTKFHADDEMVVFKVTVDTYDRLLLEVFGAQ